jgi:pimeloyl-ACP methyl ester carboxylesterase
MLIGNARPDATPVRTVADTGARPSFGGSTPVDLSIRMKVWLETVPALLQKLEVNHVSLLTHSAGTIYTLNTLLHHRAVLDPKAPYVAFLGMHQPPVALLSAG